MASKSAGVLAGAITKFGGLLDELMLDRFGGLMGGD